jgi:hypothetical protein
MPWTAGLRDDPQVRDGIKALIGLTRTSVKDHNAVGDGSTDDKAAIQAAVAWVEARGGGEIYFPKSTGAYKLNSSVEWQQDNTNIRFHFEPGAVLEGNFPDALLKRTHSSEMDPIGNGPIGGVHEIINGRFQQYHADGYCITANRCVSFKATNCQFSGGAQGGYGIETVNSQCATLDTCVFTGFTKIAVIAGNGTTVFDCDITGCVEGIRHQNLGLVVLGGRYEVNGKAMVLGLTKEGAVLQSTGVKISGLSMESNGWALHAAACGGLTMDACGVSCNVAGKQGGIWLDTVSDVLIAGLGVSSGEPFSVAGIKLDNCKQGVFAGVEVNLAAGETNHWSVLMPVSNKFIECTNLRQISDKTGDFIVEGYTWQTIYFNNADPRIGYFRDDTEMGYVGGVPPVGTVYRFVQTGIGSLTLAADGATVHFQGGVTPKNKLAGQFSAAFAEKIGPSEWITYGDLVA